MRTSIKGFSQLDVMQLGQLQKLVIESAQQDGYSPKIYWNIIYQRQTNQLYDWLYCIDGILVGYAGIFKLADSVPYITIIVNPVSRRQQIASQLWRKLTMILAKSGWRYVKLDMPNSLEYKVNWLTRHQAYCVQQYIELKLFRMPVMDDGNTSLTLRKATVTDIAMLAELHAIGFKRDITKLIQFYTNHLDTLGASAWIFTLNSSAAIAIACCESIGQGECLITNFTIHPNYRGQGYSKTILQLLLQQLTTAQSIYIEALHSDSRNLNLYRNCGFIEHSEHHIYLVPINTVTTENYMATSYEYQQADMSHLLVELHDIRKTLYEFIHRLPNKVNLPPLLAEPLAPNEAIPTRWQALCSILSLSEFEKKLLLLCIGQELIPDFSNLFALALNNPQANYITLNLALCLFNGHTAALASKSLLRQWQIIQVQSTQTLVNSPLKIAERVLHYLLGVNDFEPSISVWAQPQSLQPLDIPIYQLAAKEMLERIKTDDSALLQIISPSSEHVEQAVAWLANYTQRPVLYVDLEALPLGNSQQANFELLGREILLEKYLVFVNANVCQDPLTSPDRKRCLENFIDRLNIAFPCSLIVYTRQPLTLLHSLTQLASLDIPAIEDQVKIWQAYLSEQIAITTEELSVISQQFNLSWRQIATISQQYNYQTQSQNNSDFQNLWQLCRQQVCHRYDDKVRLVKAKAQWQDLVLSDKVLNLLKQIVNQIKYRHKVYHQLGFAKRKQRGLGISALFSGPSGTGKTTAAEVIANELQLELLHIELSSMVSKYVGETEKNLSQVFQLAEKSGAILLFDEADALFSKRSNQVQSSNDRHSNMEVSYLLQQMEAYQGLSILTTNLQANIDEAFLRRFRFTVPFSLPDKIQSYTIWQKVFPPEVAVETIDWHQLTELELSGASIQMAAINAAFLAVSQDKPVAMSHIWTAVEQELTKIGKLIRNFNEIIT